MKKLKLAIINSHSDSCSFNTILKAVKNKEIDAIILFIICSSKESYEYALKISKEQGMSFAVELVDKEAYGEIGEFNGELYKVLDKYNFDLICLAGFKYLFKVGERYKYKVINLHPALLRTSIKGKGFYGKKVYEEILRTGSLAGATVHFADDDYDCGPIIIEKEVRVLPNDTPEILGNRVCKEGTEMILPKAIQLIAEGKIKVQNNKVKVL